VRIFVQKQNQPHKETSSRRALSKTAAARLGRHTPPVLPVQRIIGNQILQRLLQADSEGLAAGSATTVSPRVEQPGAGIIIQPKLTVNLPGDIYEQEADRLAKLVMRMPQPQMQPACDEACSNTYQTERLDQEHEQLHTQHVGSSDVGQIAAPPSVHSTLRTSGQPLDPSARGFMEARFGHDFSEVRVHTDTGAAESARAVHASAYTVGNHVVFGASLYHPATSAGRLLLAHELAHVVQQKGGMRQSPRLQRQEGSDADRDKVNPCEDLRSALSGSKQVIELFREFLDRKITWDQMQSQRTPIGNAAQGVVGAGQAMPQIVQQAIKEVESWGLEEMWQGGRQLWSVLWGSEATQRQWATNEIERQEHFNLVLVRYMQENACPDVPGQ
jgi:hypothetical protein